MVCGLEFSAVQFEWRFFYLKLGVLCDKIVLQGKGVFI